MEQDFDTMVRKAIVDKKVEDIVMNSLAVLFWGGIVLITYGLIRFLSA